MNKPDYEALLMLSGGKDSCSIAFDLKEKGIPFIALTVDNGFLSDVAKSNIDKLVKTLDIDSVIIRPAPSFFQEVQDMNADMKTTCTECSLRALKVALHFAKNHQIFKIYAGFTKYTSASQGWGTRRVTTHVDTPDYSFDIINPYYGEYDLNKIRKTMADNGLEFDPTKTNCIYIQRLIQRSPENPFIEEMDMLRADGFVPDDEYARIREWLTSKSDPVA